MRWARPSAVLLVLGLVAGPAAAGGALGDEMSAAGLAAVELLPTRPPLARGRLAGSGELGVVLVAGCGAAAAEGRRAALEAAADLARTPRRHELELVLCAGPGSASEAAKAWLELLPPAARERLLAVLVLEPAAGGAAGAFGRMLPAEGEGERRLPPAWLAHAALGGARSVGVELRLGAWRRPLLAQLAGRLGRPLGESGAGPLLAAGLPALALGGADGAAPGGAPWPAVLAAIVRRCDALVGRPRGDDTYLALGGRVWARRDLYWIGLAIWGAMLVGGLPGSWRGAVGGLRRRRGRWYLPGFAFRMLFLVALLIEPVGTLALLAPAGLTTLAPVRRPPAVLALRGVALAPLLALAAHLVAAAAWPARPLRWALILAGLALALSLVGRRRPPAPPAR